MTVTSKQRKWCCDFVHGGVVVRRISNKTCFESEKAGNRVRESKIDDDDDADTDDEDEDDAEKTEKKENERKDDGGILAII